MLPLFKNADVKWLPGLASPYGYSGSQHSNFALNIFIVLIYCWAKRVSIQIKERSTEASHI